MTKLYVGNLSFSIESADLEKLFSKYGTVTEVKLVTDRDTGRKRGFGFVSMSSTQESSAAAEELNGADFMGRSLKVDLAKELPKRSSPRNRY